MPDASDPQTTLPPELLAQLNDPHPRLHVTTPTHEAETVLLDALAAANRPTPWIFQRGRHLVRVVAVDTDGTPAPQIDALTVDTLRPLVGRACRVFKYDKDSREIVIDARREQLAAVLGAPVWPFPVLAGISEVPFLRPDGSLHALAGYDAATFTLYAPALGLLLPAIADRPTAADVRAAKTFLLDDLLGEFPFLAPADKAHAVALLLLPYLRRLITGPTPIHLVEAPAAGTGKSELVAACLRPAIGARLAADPEQRDETETAKWITGKALAGVPVCWIDNVKYGLDNSVLANATTSPRWSNRALGSNEIIDIAFRPIWVVTANNPTLTEEMIRRVVRVRMDAEMAHPATRSGFRHNLQVWVPAQRGNLIAAALTLLRAWVCAGQPRGSGHLGSYEDWAAILSGVLTFLAIPGFLDNTDELYAVADPESAQWAELVEAWAERFGHSGVTASALYELAQKIPAFDLGGLDRGQQTKFGKALGRQRDKIYGTYKVVHQGVVHKAAQWALVPLRTRGGPVADTRIICTICGQPTPCPCDDLN